MPILFWVDVIALSISTVLACSLALMVLGTGPRQALNRSFGLFALVEAAWAVNSLLLRLALWLGQGNALFLSELMALAFALMGPLLLAFAVHYVGRRTRWTDLAVMLGLAAMAVFCIPLFRHQLLLGPRLDASGSIVLSLNALGFAFAGVPVAYMLWSLYLFWQRLREAREPYLALSVLVIIAGFFASGVLNVRYPIASITNTLGLVFLGYGVVSRQLFNPLREHAAGLKQEIAEREQVEAEREALLNVLQRRSTQLQTAAEVSRLVSMILDPEELINQAVHLIQECFDFYYVGLFLLDETGEYAVLRAGTGEAARQMLEAGHKLKVGGPSMIGWCTAHGQARVALDVGEEAIRFDNPVLPYTRSEMALPLISRGRCIGALTVQSTEPAAFSQEDISVLQTMADHIAIAIQNARLLEAERRRGQELESLRQASLHLTSMLELQSVLEAVVEHVLELIAPDNVHIFLYDGEKLDFGVAMWDGHLQQRPYAEPRPEGLTYTVARTAQRIVIPDVDAHPLFKERRWGGAIVSLPLCVGDRVHGVMNVAFEHPHEFSGDELNMLELLADQAAIAIHNAYLHQELRRRAEELAAALARKEELDRLKGEFIQNVSHELRSPLALIRGYAEMLDEGEFGELQPDQKQPVDIILRRARMLSDLVEDITLILEAEARPLVREEVALDELARMAVTDFRIAADQAGLNLEAEIADAPLLVSGSIAYLRRVLDNLLSNAIKFTPAGGKITVRALRQGDRVLLAVQDTGIGIAADQLERIFERFYQVDGSARRRYGGVGLGLALVKEITELHGGQVKVESELGKGSVFTVTLPALETAVGPQGMSENQ